MSTAKTSAQILKDARAKLGLTQAEVAKRAGMSTNGYAKLEQAINKPKRDSIKKLMKALDIDESKVLDLL